MTGRLDWGKCLGCRHVRANLAPLLSTLFSQGTIWAHAYHLCLFQSPGNLRRRFWNFKHSHGLIYCVFWLKDLIDQDVRDAPPCQRWFGSHVFEKYKQLQTHPETDKILKIWKFNFDLKELAQLYFSRWFCSSSKIITKCMGLVHANQNYVMTVMRKGWMMGRHLKSIWYPDNCGFVSDVATVFLIISSILILHHQPGWRVVADRKKRVFVPQIMITMIVSILRQRDGAGWLTHISLRATAENWVSSFLSFYCRR